MEKLNKNKQWRWLLFLFFSSLSNSFSTVRSFPNSTSHYHPNPDFVAGEVRHLVEISRRRALTDSGCMTGNPIDDCWRCDPNWLNNRQQLADCGIGFGRNALGGKGGQYYVVTDASDLDPVNPPPGTLRYGVIQEQPLWITFAGDMNIKLSQELLVNSFKTIDGRGANVHIAGGACITLQYVSNIIIHNVHVHDCVPTGNANVRSSPTHAGYRGKSDGDGIKIYGAQGIWVDHCELARCTDGLIDATVGSTGVTVSNSYFSHHDKVMLLGASDDYEPDNGMQVTVAFNRFGPELGQRMPRCRRGYFHVVNNDYTGWEMYAVGGSAAPTINSQGNRYTAPNDASAKEVTKRVNVPEGTWAGWDWRTEGDVMLNGAFFVPSGTGLEAKYAKASSTEPKPAALIDQLTMNVGVITTQGVNNPGTPVGGGGGGSGGPIGDGGGGISVGGGGGGSGNPIDGGGGGGVPVGGGGGGNPIDGGGGGIPVGGGGGYGGSGGGDGGYGYYGMVYGSDASLSSSSKHFFFLIFIVLFSLLHHCRH